MTHAGSPTTTPQQHQPSQPARQAPHFIVILTIAWTLALAAVVAARFRGQWTAVKVFHSWLNERGVPSYIRNFDSLILFALASFLGAWLVARWWGGSVTGLLVLRRGGRGWEKMVPLALLPMVVGGLVLGLTRSTTQPSLADTIPKVVGGVIRAPIAEELLFRGLLVGVCAAALGWRGPKFWTNALLAAVLFAVTHVSWNVQAAASGWPTLLVTLAGGLWYAWLLARWGSLWVPMTLHAGMNLGWLLAEAGGGAGGGGWIENLLRAATITIATWWTIRATRAASHAA